MSADIVSCSIFISDAICRLVADLLPNITRTFSFANLSPTAEKGNVVAAAAAAPSKRTVDLELELELELEDAIVVDVDLLKVSSVVVVVAQNRLHFSASRFFCVDGRRGGGARTQRRGRRIARPPPEALRGTI